MAALISWFDLWLPAQSCLLVHKHPLTVWLMDLERCMPVLLVSYLVYIKLSTDDFFCAPDNYALFILQPLYIQIWYPAIS